MSPTPEIVLRYATAAGTESALVVTETSFAGLTALAVDALGLDPDAVKISYDDDEGELVSIGSQVELDEALRQHDHHLVCRLAPLPTTPDKRRPAPDAGRLRINVGTFVVLFAVIPCLVAAVAVLVAVPKSSRAVADSCPNLMQQWATAIETESVNNDFVAPSPIYDLLHVCPRDLALYWIGRYEYLQGNEPEALERFMASSKLNPAHAASHLWMGRCLDRLDRPGDALKAFAAAAHLAPYLAEAQFEYGRSLSTAHVVSSAAYAAAGAALSADLNFDEARLLKGRLAYEMGDADSAYSEFAILTARHPDSAEYRVWKRRAFDDILRGR